MLDSREGVRYAEQKTGRIRQVDRVIACIRVWLPGFIDERVDGEELPRRWVVVAAYEVDEPSRVGVAFCVSERGGAGEPSGGFRVAPGVVAGVGAEAAAGIDDAADAAEQVAEEVLDRAAAQVGLLDRLRPSA